jgi:hypothetical protein
MIGRVGLGAVALLAAPAVHAQEKTETPLHAAVGAPDNLKLSGTFRAQIEGIDEQFRPNAARDDRLLTFRTTIAAEYDTGPVRFGAELWDARGYLEERDSSTGTSEVNALELVQAYVGLDLNSDTTLDAGRMTLDIGSRRLVSRQNFRNTTNAFTGVHLHHEQEGGSRFDAFWTMPQMRLPSDRDGVLSNHVVFDRETDDLQFFGASYEIPVGSNLRLEAFTYGLVERDAPQYLTANRHLATPGVRLHRKPAKRVLDLDLEYEGQIGKARASTNPADLVDRRVRAWAGHAEIGYTFGSAWQPRVAVLYDQGSGNGSSDHIGRFDTLYGARSFELNPTSLYGVLARSNAMTPGVRVEAKPRNRWDGFAMYRALWLASATDAFGASSVRDPSGQSGRFAGQQVEGRVRYWIVPRIAQIDAGAAILFKGRFLRDAPNAPTTGNTRYGYLSFNLNF